MDEFASELTGHRDRNRWNAKYEKRVQPTFAAHRLAVRALSTPLPEGPVLDLACGPSGSALLAAARGRRVIAVDISEVALGLLGEEADRRGLGDLVTLIHADLREWRPRPASCSLVLCTGYWDRELFAAAAQAVRPGGVLAWEAFTMDARRDRPHLPAEWCLGPGEPASLLPAGFTVVDDLPDNGTKRRLLARRRP
jgi:SAM-dependent methyltransferase